MKLTSDIKQFLILNDFVSVNEQILQHRQMYKAMQTECDNMLFTLRDEMAADLHELEEEYYSSMYK
jgi:mediator of RNA polymerase II transcription subunit 22